MNQEKSQSSQWDLAVLDLAGTTLYDNGVVIEAVRAAAAIVAPRKTFSDAAITPLRGGSKKALFEKLVPEGAKAALAAFNRILGRLVESGGAEPVPGAEEAILALQAEGLAVCLTTGFDRPVVDVILDRLGWRGLADKVLTAGEAGRGRPYPDLVLQAALSCRVSAMDRVVVCGDTASDIEAGRRAGAGLLVGVLTGAQTHHRLETADAILDSVGELPALLAGRAPMNARPLR